MHPSFQDHGYYQPVLNPFTDLDMVQESSLHYAAQHASNDLAFAKHINDQLIEKYVAKQMAEAGSIDVETFDLPADDAAANLLQQSEQLLGLSQ